MGDVIHVGFGFDWRPVKLACWWCGAVWTQDVREATTAVSRLECPYCEMCAGQITHEPPEGWENMTIEELGEFAWGPDDT